MKVRKTYALEARGRGFVLGRKTWVMGILNVTPDSFSDGGAYLGPEAAAARGIEMIADGADIIDIGGESTRPGSRPVPEDEELGRVVPAVRSLRERTDTLISVDTTKAAVAGAALDAGADIVNDISALRFDRRMAGVVAASGSPVVLMHMRGTPETMQTFPAYRDLFGEIAAFLAERIEAAREAGIAAEQIIVDPGIGFGKTVEDNLAIVDGLGFLEALDRPVLAGASRKGFIGRTLGLEPGDRLEGSLAAGVLCIARGAHILRVHDVRAARRAADMADAILSRGAAGLSPEDGRSSACRP
jgi:dihydropteroate synthase